MWQRIAAVLFLCYGWESTALAVDYDLAWSLKKKLQGKVSGLNVSADWSAEEGCLLYSLRPPSGDTAASRRVDLNSGEVGPVSLGDQPMQALTWQAPDSCRSVGQSSTDTEIRFDNQTTRTLNLFWITSNGGRRSYGTIPPHKTRDQHTYAGHAWLITDSNQSAIACLAAKAHPSVALITPALLEDRPAPEPKPAVHDRFTSPDGQWRISFRNHNAFLVSTQEADPIRLTDDGTPQDGYRPPVHWSPDSRYVLFNRRKEAPHPKVTVIDSTPDDRIQPQVNTYPYRKPGDEIPRDTPILFKAHDPVQIEINPALFPTPWAVHRYHWTPDSSEVFFEYNQRGHQLYRVLAIRATDGTVRTVIEEQSDTFINYSNKIDGRHLDATNQILWMSERDGWNHLYVVDRTSGATRQLTRGEWVVRGIEHVDEEAGQVWFRMMGFDADQDPYHVHYARINLDGTGFTRLTQGNGTHSVAFSPDRGHYIDTWSRVDHPPVHELRRARDGALLCELGRADATELVPAGWIAPEPFRANGRDGETDVWGVIYRPTHFDASNAYPVIEQIYAGPHGHHVPKTFAAYRNPQALAELGFIVVQIDGMGTNWRSKAFHDVAWKNLKDGGFPDRIAWLRAAAETYPYLDLARVGIYGGSAGGQNAMRAVLDHHDVYRAAVADCGCHDNRMDKIWWNEAWMGWPVDESYAENSNVTHAHRLGGALQLTVGELDRNVDPASTMQVVDALIKADKDFELIVFPGKGHGAGGSRYGRRRMYDFFVRHLQPGPQTATPSAAVN